jgi:hypothetical protein
MLIETSMEVVMIERWEDASLAKDTGGIPSSFYNLEGAPMTSINKDRLVSLPPWTHTLLSLSRLST